MRLPQQRLSAQQHRLSSQPSQATPTQSIWWENHWQPQRVEEATESELLFALAQKDGEIRQLQSKCNYLEMRLNENAAKEEAVRLRRKQEDMARQLACES